MKFLRSLMLAVVTAVALMVPVATMPTADAQTPHQQPGHHHLYRVYYWTHAHGHWHFYSSHHHHHSAVQDVQYLHSLGYHAFYN